MNTNKLKIVNGAFGRIDVTWNGGTPSYGKVYYIKDHLGSIRRIVNTSGTITNAQDYYAYGDYIRSYTAGSTNDKYRFTGKERDTETNYDYFGARYYDSELGRWMSVDPLATKYANLSPYNYTLNNPINNFDTDGRDVYGIHIAYVKVSDDGIGPAAGQSFAFAYDDQGSAGILSTTYFGAGAGGFQTFAGGGFVWRKKSINDLKGLNLNISVGLGLTFGASADFSTDLTSAPLWAFTAGPANGAMAFIGGSYSKLLLKSELTSLRNKYGAISIKIVDGKVIIYDNNGHKISTLSLPDSQVNSTQHERNSDGFFPMLQDKTKTHSGRYRPLSYDPINDPVQ